MANRSRRPRRGPRDDRNILITGDVAGDRGTRQPQGGARPVEEEWRESGDLEAREFGVPQADIPGGVRHLVNPETVPRKPPGVFERPADYHKYHGVESDDGQYYPPPGDVGKSHHIAVVPQAEHAVPVYIVEQGSSERTRRVAATDTIAVPAIGTGDPARVCNQDTARDEIMLLCTDAANDVLIAEDRASLASATAAQHVGCALLSHSATTYTRIATQSELFATSAAASASHLSIIAITSIASGR